MTTPHSIPTVLSIVAGYVVCAVIESLAEPLWVIAQQQQLVQFIVGCLSLE